MVAGGCRSWRWSLRCRCRCSCRRCIVAGVGLVIGGLVADCRRGCWLVSHWSLVARIDRFAFIVVVVVVFCISSWLVTVALHHHIMVAHW